MKEEVIYTIPKIYHKVLKNHYGFDIGYEDEPGKFKQSENILNKFDKLGLLPDLNNFCLKAFKIPFEKVFISNKEEKFIANDSVVIDFNLPFNKYYTFKLNPTAKLNEKGDVVEILYKKVSGEVAIKETREYERYVKGELPNEIYTMNRKIIIKYYKYNNDYVEKVYNQILNDYERKKIDKKAMSAIIDKVRNLTGNYIIETIKQKAFQGQIEIEKVQKIIQETAYEALQMLEKLNDEISTFRDDRKKEPLINALDNYERTPRLTNDIINFIKSNVDINYYKKIK